MESYDAAKRPRSTECVAARRAHRLRGLGAGVVQLRAAQLLLLHNLLLLLGLELPLPPPLPLARLEA